MATSAINVNDLRKTVEKNGSLASAIGTSSVYSGEYKTYARKRELNITITGKGNEEIMMGNLPLFDSSDLNDMRSDAATNKFIHIGMISVSVEPLLHQRYIDEYGDSIKGYCAIYDGSFQKMEEAVISLHQYHLRNGRADFVSFPNHCLSLTDPNISSRVSMMMGIDGISVKEGTELFNVCIGYLVTCTNTLNPTGSRGIKDIPVTGTQTATSMEVFGDKAATAFEMSFNARSVHLQVSDNDTYIKDKQGFLSWLYRKPQRHIRRRNFKTSNSNSKDPESCSLSSCSRRSVSSRFPNFHYPFYEEPSYDSIEATDIEIDKAIETISKRREARVKASVKSN